MLCAQSGDDQYLDPCQWNGSPAVVSVLSGQAFSGASVKLTPASTLNIQVKDSLKALSAKTKDGRVPDLSLGVWGPKGLYYPVHTTSKTKPGTGASSGAQAYSFKLAVPRDTPLKLSISSHDLKLGDAAGTPLTANASQQAFQHATGDPAPKSFSFSVLGLLP
jgi:hypothetical protein